MLSECPSSPSSSTLCRPLTHFHIHHLPSPLPSIPQLALARAPPERKSSKCEGTRAEGARE
eukprot:212523-Pyramimonas_sp.AAC.1